MAPGTSSVDASRSPDAADGPPPGSAAEDGLYTSGAYPGAADPGAVRGVPGAEPMRPKTECPLPPGTVARMDCSPEKTGAAAASAAAWAAEGWEVSDWKPPAPPGRAPAAAGRAFASSGPRPESLAKEARAAPAGRSAAARPAAAATGWLTGGRGEGRGGGVGEEQRAPSDNGSCDWPRVPLSRLWETRLAVLTRLSHGSGV
jgi:hypothetical protein